MGLQTSFCPAQTLGQDTGCGLARESPYPGHSFPLVEMEREGEREQICPQFLFPPLNPLIESLPLPQKCGPNASTQQLDDYLHLDGEGKGLDRNPRALRETLCLHDGNFSRGKEAFLHHVAKSC